MEVPLALLVALVELIACQAVVERTNAENAYYLGQFFNLFVNASARVSVLEVGSAFTGATANMVRTLAGPRWQWVGVDVASGDGVDVVLGDPHRLPFPAGHFDAVFSVAVLTHVRMFWVLFLEMCRVSKSWVYIDDQVDRGYVPMPFDSWRFMDDAPESLALWGRHSGANVTTVFASAMDEFIWSPGRRHIIMVYAVGERALAGPPFPAFEKGFRARYVRRYAHRCWRHVPLHAIAPCCVTGYARFCFESAAAFDACCLPGPGVARAHGRASRSAPGVSAELARLLPGVLPYEGNPLYRTRPSPGREAGLEK